MRGLVAILFIVAGIIGGACLGLYMLVDGIINIIHMIKSDIPLEAWTLAKQILKIIFAETCAGIMMFCGFVFGISALKK